jgi:hypothetical protein
MLKKSFLEPCEVEVWIDGLLGFLTFEPLVTTCDPQKEQGLEVNGHLTRLSKPEHSHDTSCCHCVNRMQCVRNLLEFSGAP